MATSIEERILDLVKTKLEGITTGGGYEQTVKKVTRASGPDAPMDFDLATEVPGLQIRHIETPSEPHIRGALECELQIEVHCITEADPTDEKMADLIADVQKLLLANQRWDEGGGGLVLARRTWLGTAVIHETEVGDSHATGFVPCSILFRVDATNPYALKEV